MRRLGLQRLQQRARVSCQNVRHSCNSAKHASARSTNFEPLLEGVQYLETWTGREKRRRVQSLPLSPRRPNAPHEGILEGKENRKKRNTPVSWVHFYACYGVLYEDVRKKRPPKRLSQRPNDIYVNRKSDFASQLARSHKLLDQG